MVKHLLVAFLFSLPFANYAQVKDSSNIKSLGISIPVIWNNSEATFYRLGSPMYPSGKATSYGININYSRTIFKNIYGIIGIGYFKQKFGIIRPFTYDSPIQFGWVTDSYRYDNIHLSGGLGYNLQINKVFSIKGSIVYNQFYSFRQKYINHSSIQDPQVKNKFFSTGRAININVGLERSITNKISFSIYASFPFFIHWNKDEIFNDSGYSNDEQQIARNKFSLGTILSCNYHF